METKTKRPIGPVLLCGLIIGPILGSGIIILPPMAYGAVQHWALPAWLLIILLGFGFAWVFSRLSLLHPGEAGVADAIGQALGCRVRHLTSLYLLGAVCFAPVVVTLTATRYLLSDQSALQPYLPFALVIGVGLLLLQRLSFIGRLSLVLSSLAALILFVGGLRVLGSHLPWSWNPSAAPVPAPGQLLHTLLLLFWTIVGWEVIGNYSAEVREPHRTLPRAALAGALCIAMVSLTVAGAVHVLGQEGNATVSEVVAGLFGPAAPVVTAVLVGGLCLTTCLLFVGAVARLIRALAGTGELPRVLARSTAQGAPLAATALLTLIHLLVLLGVAQGLLQGQDIVAIADAFFVGNALLGLLAATRLLTGGMIRLTAACLALLVALLLFSAPSWVLLIMLFLALKVVVYPLLSPLFSRPSSLHRHG